MGSEMGNNNVSGIREEQKPAVEVAGKGQEAVPADDKVKGENHIILGNKAQDFNTKGEELSSSDGLSSANGSDAEAQKSNENEIGSKESNHEAISQDASSPESNDSNRQESDVQKTDSADEGNFEKPLEIHEQTSIGKETETNEVERTDSVDSESETMSQQPSKSSDHSTSSLEDSQSSLSSLSDACNSEEKDNSEKSLERDENLHDFRSEEICIVENEPQETNTSTGKWDAQLPPLRENISEFCDSSTEVALQYDLLDPSLATPEPQENCIIHDKENDLIPAKSEEDANKQESTEEKLNEFISKNSAAASATLQDASSKENGEEVVVETTSGSCSEKAYLNGKVKVTHKRSKSVVAGNRRGASFDQLEDIEEDIKMLPTFTSILTQLSTTEKHNEEEMAMEKATTEETMGIKNGDRGTSEERRSVSELLNWESSLMDISSASKLSSHNDNASLLSPDAAENGMKTANTDFQDLFVNGNSNLDAHKETVQTLASSSSTLESFKPANDIQIQTTLGTSADTEVLCNWSNQQCPSDQIRGLSNPGNQVQRGKSPSFDFGFQLDAKSEDSDQTPLLHHDKTAARSFSGFANVRFQNRIIQTDCGRKSLDFEPVAVEVEVEEKTMRMERSDSDISRASFMNLLKKNEKGSSNSQFLPKKQESPAAISNHSEELSSEELALTSVKRSKQRKNRPSIFTSCICCTASIH